MAVANTPNSTQTDKYIYWPMSNHCALYSFKSKPMVDRLFTKQISTKESLKFIRLNLCASFIFFLSFRFLSAIRRSIPFCCYRNNNKHHSYELRAMNFMLTITAIQINYESYMIVVDEPSRDDKTVLKRNQRTKEWTNERKTAIMKLPFSRSFIIIN